jgi:uncharacterized membrane protein (UPF0136 family)
MARRCHGNGLVIAGLVVTLVGVATGLRETLHLPGYWVAIAVGLALLVAGALRGVRRDDRPGSASPGPS